MSSPRSASHCDGVLEIHDRAVGPIRLPTDSTESFLRRFNEEYGGLGLAIVLSGTLAPEIKTSTVATLIATDIVAENIPVASVGLPPTNDRARDTVIEELSRTLAATFCGAHSGRSAIESGGSSEGLLSLLDRVSLATATQALCGVSMVVHVSQLIVSLDNGAERICGAPSNVVREQQEVDLDEGHWQSMRQQLANAYDRFASSLTSLDILNAAALSACLGVVANSGYHFGMIRQKLAFQRIE